MNLKEAKKILPKQEFESFEGILANQISRTPAASLRKQATLARRLRDKYRDLAHQQAAGVRTRRTNEVDTDLNDRKARLFQEIIDRLEEELSVPRREGSADAKKTSRRSGKDVLQAERDRLERRDQKHIQESLLRDPRQSEKDF